MTPDGLWMVPKMTPDGSRTGPNSQLGRTCLQEASQADAEQADADAEQADADAEQNLK